MIEAIIWFLVVLDCTAYTILTVTASWHSKKSHHFWKGVPLYWGIAAYYIFLVAWLGYALYRLGALF